MAAPMAHRGTPLNSLVQILVYTQEKEINLTAADPDGIEGGWRLMKRMKPSETAVAGASRAHHKLIERLSELTSVLKLKSLDAELY